MRHSHQLILAVMLSAGIVNATHGAIQPSCAHDKPAACVEHAFVCNSTWKHGTAAAAADADVAGRNVCW